MVVNVVAIVMLALLIGYYYFSYKRINSDYVQCVEAGGLKNVSESSQKNKSFRTRPLSFRVRESHQKIDSSQYIRIIVKGWCMKPRGIEDGDQLLVESINPNDAKGRLHAGDIVLLYVPEKRVYKIRELETIKDDELVTFYYKEGNKQYSSTNHKLSMVRGVVRFKIPRKLAV